jgi:hypothetical protein
MNRTCPFVRYGTQHASLFFNPPPFKATVLLNKCPFSYCCPEMEHSARTAPRARTQGG